MNWMVIDTKHNKFPAESRDAAYELAERRNDTHPCLAPHTVVEHDSSWQDGLRLLFEQWITTQMHIEVVRATDGGGYVGLLADAMWAAWEASADASRGQR